MFRWSQHEITDIDSSFQRLKNILKGVSWCWAAVGEFLFQTPWSFSLRQNERRIEYCRGLWVHCLIYQVLCDKQHSQQAL